MPTKTKAATMFNGVVLEEIMEFDQDILWCWQKWYPTGLQRVTAFKTGEVCIWEDRDDSMSMSRYRAIYLDDDCIAAINHARSLTNECVRGSVQADH